MNLKPTRHSDRISQNQAPLYQERNGYQQLKKHFVKYTAFIFIFCCISCGDYTKTSNEPVLEQEYKDEINYDTLLKNVVRGDFDGDGNEDILNELLISSLDDNSIDVIPHFEYDSLVAFIHAKKPILSLQSLDKNIPDLIITKNASFGLMWLKNEGDLNNDGSDEISIVIDWADWSQVNKCMIYSLQKNKWVIIGQFNVREWQLERDKDFNGFIVKNKKGDYEVLTFDSEIIEVNKPLSDVLMTKKVIKN